MSMTAQASASMSQRIRELEEELAVTEKLLAERNRLLKAIPACPVHGADCVPHAIEWVQAHLVKDAETDCVCKTEQECTQEPWCRISGKCHKQTTKRPRIMKPGPGTLAALRHVCPHCGAPPGMLCMSPSDEVRKYVHSKRMALARSKVDSTRGGEQ